MHCRAASTAAAASAREVSFSRYSPHTPRGLDDVGAGSVGGDHDYSSTGQLRPWSEASILPGGGQSGGSETKWVVPEDFSRSSVRVWTPLPGEETLYPQFRLLLEARETTPLAHQLALSYLREAHARRTHDMADTVRIVRQLLPTGELTAELVARQFGIHSKTLQRRLASEGANFAELVDRCRRELACRLLVDTDLPVSQVSRRLGYAENSVFTCACKRWFNMTPTAYRNR